MQVQHFMYFTRLCTLLTFWVYTPLLYQNLTFCTKLHHSNRGRHQFSRRKHILVLNNFHAFSYIKNFPKKKIPYLMSLKKYWDVSGNETFIFFGLNAKFCQRKSMPEKESIMVVRCELKIPSLGITVGHHSASLVMPNSYPGDRIFNQHLSQPLYSYSTIGWASDRLIGMYTVQN